MKYGNSHWKISTTNAYVMHTIAIHLIKFLSRWDIEEIWDFLIEELCQMKAEPRTVVTIRSTTSETVSLIWDQPLPDLQLQEEQHFMELYLWMRQGHHWLFIWHSWFFFPESFAQSHRGGAGVCVFMCWGVGGGY